MNGPVNELCPYRYNECPKHVYSGYRVNVQFLFPYFIRVPYSGGDKLGWCNIDLSSKQLFDVANKEHDQVMTLLGKEIALGQS